ncbi:MAG TPA: YceK/YidQ family lipoprotein [Thiomicrospira sp.]|nr:YceK/YidQ family lipoprotein [Thiomicrospira sp.]
MLVKRLFIFGIVAILSGCSTIKTLDSATIDSPVVFSGTRLNICAITDDKVGMIKFNTKPVEYPVLDLPASFLLDLIMFPLAISVF